MKEATNVPVRCGYTETILIAMFTYGSSTDIMRVLLLRGKHPMYETYVTNPPAGVEFFPRTEGGELQEYTLYDSANSVMRSLFNLSYRLVRVPRFIPVFRSYDLVHSCRGLLVVGCSNYVVDFEHLSSFVGMRHDLLQSMSMRKLIGKAFRSSRCRFLLAHSQAAKRTLSLLDSGDEFTDKTRILYPVIAPKGRARTTAEHDVPHVLFMGEYLWKGGREFLESCIRVSAKQDFRVTYISLRVHPPEAVINRAKKRCAIRFINGPVARSRLFADIYPSTDIFAMPTYIDTFGYAYLEAMAHGIPCIGTYHFAVPEIIENNVTGILVHPPVSFLDSLDVSASGQSIEHVDSSQTVSDLSEALNMLLDSRSLREKMGLRALESVTEGHFSIRRRNEILRHVYEECLPR